MIINYWFRPGFKRNETAFTAFAQQKRNYISKMKKMKKLLFLILIVFLFSCDEGEKNQSGYNCVNGQCTATFENPTYLTLQDCQTVCGISVPTQPKPGSVSPGSVSITLSWDIKRYCNIVWTLSPCWDVMVGLGYSQTDVDKEAYFNHKDLSEPGIYTVTNLAPGVYYYRAKKTIRTSCVSANGCPAPPPVIKSGKFTITSNKTISISVSL
ncbi:MAG TPA: hypothetical protein VMV77_05775 [Bacteroidales bacterium]|nr:hypothetical protein [Bacteroidales bacterium]